MTKFVTEQETFWAGQFGNDYVDRNRDNKVIAFRTALFARILADTNRVTSALELGANVGLNLRAIRNVLPDCSFTAVEINDKASEVLDRIPDTKVLTGSILEFSPSELGHHDLVFTCGVLIHVAPEYLPEIYARLYECSNRYILINEYYNPVPTEVSYRGHAGRLFKRDFAGDFLETFKDVELVDYGFQYRRDNNFPADDMTWFLLDKSKCRA